MWFLLFKAFIQSLKLIYFLCITQKLLKMECMVVECMYGMHHHLKHQRQIKDCSHRNCQVRSHGRSGKCPVTSEHSGILQRPNITLVNNHFYTNLDFPSLLRADRQILFLHSVRLDPNSPSVSFRSCEREIKREYRHVITPLLEQMISDSFICLKIIL